MRLIDADKILYFKGKDIVGEDAYMTQKDVIDEMPTVDAKPIRHGHWIPVNPDVYGAEYFECSVCGMYSRDGLIRKELDYEYCPNCGAKMDASGEK